MTTLLDDGARELRDAVMKLAPPPLGQDTLARIVARRASGERVLLPTSDTTVTLYSRRVHQVVAVLAAVAAMVVVALVLNIRRDIAAGRADSIDQFALAPADLACADFSKSRDSSLLRHLMVSAFGVSAACGAEPPPDPPISVDPSQIARGSFTYGSLTITDGVFTSVHAPTTFTISHTLWHDTPALLAVRVGPLITRVSLDSITVSLASLAPLHWASWYPTQYPVGSMHADFDSSMVTITMTGRYDTVATFPYHATNGQLPFGWTRSLVVPALPLTSGWHGTLQIALPIHPHAYKLLGRPWETMSLRVIGREKLRVAAGDFDCWKVQVGEPEDQSYMWVSTSNHLVIRSQTIHRFGDTEFEDRVDLQRMILIPR